MEPQYWQLAVVAAIVGLAVWAYRRSQRATLAVAAVVLLITSGLLFYTFVLDEPYLERDANGLLDIAAWVGIPALLGIAAGALAVRRGSPRA
ncbi:hypothetical protein AMIS_30160 [Actinoplanes missouriensis 431]|uniref:Integral membrane protein n=1 Tax=Actinoplanes missouriensis (strain ATCC 14538 / DSM 43046 / CBS 188.64 / JCM 3121 / NBRC 102363 / NCIMB 12654 / NRRL B-3342 / UNCC 431) TaxID=512565 RepID=I0H5E9_ACTM4|nr:hypothetical protein [Actinoplanes missouriensis]BAL88236.1 hypothetical protein AMIS_30160 [Actinoplanes missouriensis 431]